MNYTSRPSTHITPASEIIEQLKGNMNARVPHSEVGVVLGGQMAIERRERDTERGGNVRRNPRACRRGRQWALEKLLSSLLYGGRRRSRRGRAHTSAGASWSCLRSSACASGVRWELRTDASGTHGVRAHVEWFATAPDR